MHDFAPGRGREPCLGGAAQGIIRQNISDNRPAWAANGGTAEAAELSWGLTDVRKMGAPWAEPAYVIAADVIYDRTLFQPLLNTLNAYGE